MYITTLEPGQVLLIGDQIRLSIHRPDPRQKKTKMGIDAPKSVMVEREEILYQHPELGTID
ncbi:carbon storage regulator [Motiliproteus sp.]|uniref:carbon storage regulator n=1 Tax=Motiliproteus sp. TaxID=1898955 RepID=UPI003BA8B3FF